MKAAIRAEGDTPAIRSPNRALIGGRAEGKARRHADRQFLGPNVNVPPIAVDLVENHAISVGGEIWIGDGVGSTDGANWTPIAFVPRQLGSGDAFAGLRYQSFRSHDVEQSKVNEWGVLDVVTNGARIAAESKGVRVKTLSNENIIPEVQQVAR